MAQDEAAAPLIVHGGADEAEGEGVGDAAKAADVKCNPTQVDRQKSKPPVFHNDPVFPSIV